MDRLQVSGSTLRVVVFMRHKRILACESMKWTGTAKPKIGEPPYNNMKTSSKQFAVHMCSPMMHKGINRIEIRPVMRQRTKVS